MIEEQEGEEEEVDSDDRGQVQSYVDVSSGEVLHHIAVVLNLLLSMGKEKRRVNISREGKFQLIFKNKLMRIEPPHPPFCSGSFW